MVKKGLQVEIESFTQKPGAFFIGFRLDGKAIGHHNLRVGWTVAEVEALVAKWGKNYSLGPLDEKRLTDEILAAAQKPL